MFDPTSRYATLAQTPRTLALPDGRIAAYVGRRFLPPIGSLPTLAQVTIGPAERLDVFTARTLGDPQAFWRICDGNDALKPAELEHPGRTLTVPVPTA